MEIDFSAKNQTKQNIESSYISVIGLALNAIYENTPCHSLQSEPYFWLKMTIKHSTCKLFIDEML